MSYGIYVLLSHLANQTLTTVSVGLYYIAIIEYIILFSSLKSSH